MKSSSSTYFSKLDHLRFFAALLVVVWHAIHSNGIIAPSYVPKFWGLSIFEEGHTGVALFITLSGFLFQALGRNSDLDYVQFLRNRVLRIAPLFLTWVLFIYYTGTADPAKLFFSVFALLNRDTLPEVNTVLGGGWTIVVEFQFYLIFPFLLAFTRRYGLRYLCGLLALAIALRAGVWYARDSVQMLAYWTMFGRIDQFLLGMIGCEVFFRHPRLFRSRIALAGLIAVWALLMHRFNELGGFYNHSGYPSTSSIWVYFTTLEGFFYSSIAAFYLGIESRMPAALDKFFAWLGTLSFSFYLNHGIVIEIAYKISIAMGFTIIGFWRGLAFALIACIPLVTVVSAATYYLIEKPFLSLRRNYRTQQNHVSHLVDYSKASVS
jgi:peptidoglycan/LPS O-acetylase OafA/YrhL